MQILDGDGTRSLSFKPGAALSKPSAGILLFLLGAAAILNGTFDVRSLSPTASSTGRILGHGRQLQTSSYTLVGNGYFNFDEISVTSVNTIEECAQACEDEPTCTTFDSNGDGCYLYTSASAISLYQSGNFGLDVDVAAYSKDPAVIDAIDAIDPSNTYPPSVEISSGGASGDPVMSGIQGQLFKFDGRSDAWYANVASPSLQWNLGFHKFDQCPEGEDMFITGTAINVVNAKGNSGMDSILVEVKDGGCPEGEVCLAGGRLVISYGDKTISAPGDYDFSSKGIRIIAHNTYGSCSRKWFDYKETEEIVDEGESDKLNPPLRKSSSGPRIARKLQANVDKRPIDYLIQSKGQMLDAEDCDAWIQERASKDDLFKQEGGWSTVYVETPVASFHIELRQNDVATEEVCAYSSLDLWASAFSAALLEEPWGGILGETRNLKHDSFGTAIMSDRAHVLNHKEDEAYEVASPVSTDFDAKTSGD